MYGEISTVLEMNSGTVSLYVLQRHDPDAHPCTVYYTEELPKGCPVRPIPFDARRATWVHKWGDLLAQLNRYPWHWYRIVQVDDAFAAQLHDAWHRRWATDPALPRPKERTEPVMMHNIYDWLPDHLADRCVRWVSEILPAMQRHQEWRKEEAQRRNAERKWRAMERRLEKLMDEDRQISESRRSGRGACDV